jgi:hypothetical protein
MMKEMTARDIIGKCVAQVVDAAKYTQIINVKPSVTKDGRARIMCHTKSYALADGVPKKPFQIVRHKTLVEAVHPGAGLYSGTVKVSCDCEDFWARWEYALNRNGAADIRFSNGQPPVEKNPRRVPGACKHVFKVLKAIRAHKV